MICLGHQVKYLVVSGAPSDAFGRARRDSTIQDRVIARQNQFLKKIGFSGGEVVPSDPSLGRVYVYERR